VGYSVYAIDFTVPSGDLYKISVSGPAAATSPTFAVDSADKLYSRLLLNTLFFYETERDGADYIRNALRDAPGHLKDVRAQCIGLLHWTATISSIMYLRPRR
jgi:hypothetical protein